MSDETATDRNGLEVIGLDECLILLASSSYGRLAYLDGGSPSIVPFNHLVDGSSVVIRSLDGGKLGAAIFERAVAFQLDDLDVTSRTGWSVLVRGRAEVVEGSETEAYDARLESWAVRKGARTTWVRIVTDEVSGRRLNR